MDKFGGKKPKPSAIKTPLRDGDTDRDDDAYADAMFINANSTTAPQVVDARVKPLLDRDEVYSGCYVNVSVNFYAFNTNGNRGVAAGLGNIQKVRDGERLDGSVSADKEFRAVATAEVGSPPSSSPDRRQAARNRLSAPCRVMPSTSPIACQLWPASRAAWTAASRSRSAASDFIIATATCASSPLAVAMGSGPFSDSISAKRSSSLRISHHLLRNLVRAGMAWKICTDRFTPTSSRAPLRAGPTIMR